MPIPGTIPVTGILAPTALTDTYPITDPKYGIDGLRNVADYTERNNIPIDRRREGMVVGTISTGEYWKLKAAPWAMDNTDWELFFDLSNTWTLNGNTVGTTYSIGTIDNYDFPIITNNIERLRVLKSGEIGINIISPAAKVHIKSNGDTSASTALRIDSDTVNNIFWVRDDGVVNFKNELWRDNQRFLYANPNSTIGNLFLGYSTGNTVLTSNYNIGIGSHVLPNNMGSGNMALGYESLYSNTTGSNNIAIGYRALFTNTVGYANLALGSFSLSSNTIGSFNIAISYGALNYNTTGNGNMALGYQSLFANTIGYDNIAIGSLSLYSNISGHNNIALGKESLCFNTNSNSNIALGYRSLYFNTIGSNNIAIGVNTFYFNTTGFFNTAIGSSALYNNTSGAYNIVVGGETMFNNTTGYNNVAVGLQALYSNTIGYNNTALGHQALYSNTIGDQNVAFGYRSLFNNTSGVYNTAVGSKALETLTTGSENVAIGYSALQSVLSTSTGNIAIGAYSGQNASGSDNVFLGRGTGFNNNSASASILIGSSADFTNSSYTSAIAIGAQAAIRESNIMVVGSDSTIINKLFLGRGQVSTNNGSFSLSIHGKPGSNINDVTPLTDASAAANIFYIDGSRGTGTGRGGNIIFRTANAGSTSNSQNSLTEVLKITDTQNVFIKIPLTAPANGDFIDHGIINTPQFAAYLDETNNFLYFKVKYSDGSFKEGRVSLL